MTWQGLRPAPGITGSPGARPDPRA